MFAVVAKEKIILPDEKERKKICADIIIFDSEKLGRINPGLTIKRKFMYIIRYNLEKFIQIPGIPV